MPSVAQIDGLNIPGGAPAIPAPAAAYSVRLLDSALGVPTYTGAAMRVRRVTGAGQAGNDDEADVGFDSNDVISLESPVSNFSVGGSNATTLGQFLNVGTVNSITYTDADSLAPNTAAAYVDGWKDQSGNGNDAEQTAPASQPQIHVGTVDTDLILENGKPAIKPAATNDYLFFNIAASAAGATCFSVMRNPPFGATCFIRGATGYMGIGNNGSTSTGIDANSGNVSYRLDEAAWTPVDRDQFYDETVDSQHLFAFYTDATTNFTNTFGYTSNYGMAIMQEAIFYRSNEFTSGNLSGIETDLKTYFNTP